MMVESAQEHRRLAGESFSDRVPDECRRNEQWFNTLAQACQEIASWWRDHGKLRPHRSLVGCA